MTTSRERQEVATRLRKGGVARSAQEAYALLLSRIGIRPQLPAESTYEEALRCLADLIDPVCELSLDFSMENIKCSACNRVIPHGTNPLEMKYCPNCGARVVSCND